MDKQQTAAVLQLHGALDTALTGLDELRSELQDEFDELTEKQQEAPKGEKLKAQIDALEEASDAIGTAMASLQSATG